MGVQGGLVDGVLEGLRVQSQGDLGVLGGQEAQVAQRMKMVALRGRQQAQGASGDQMGVQGVLGVLHGCQGGQAAAQSWGWVLQAQEVLVVADCWHLMMKGVQGALEGRLWGGREVLGVLGAFSVPLLSEPH